MHLFLTLLQSYNAKVSDYIDMIGYEVQQLAHCVFEQPQQSNRVLDILDPIRELYAKVVQCFGMSLVREYMPGVGADDDKPRSDDYGGIVEGEDADIPSISRRAAARILRQEQAAALRDPPTESVGRQFDQWTEEQKAVYQLYPHRIAWGKFGRTRTEAWWVKRRGAQNYKMCASAEDAVNTLIDAAASLGIRNHDF
jgi:hypothetical protein